MPRRPNHHRHPFFTNVPISDEVAPPMGEENEFDPLSSPRNPLEKLIEGTLGPLSRLRETIDLTLDQVSQWIAHPDNRKRISNLVTLLDAQTQLMICQYRLVAVARLTDVMQSQAGAETIRRACADLLRVRLIDPYKDEKMPEKLPPPKPVPRMHPDDVRKIFQALSDEQAARDSRVTKRGTRDDPVDADDDALKPAGHSALIGYERADGACQTFNTGNGENP